MILTHLGLRGLDLQVSVTARMGRLLLAFCLAYVLSVLLGESPLGHEPVDSLTTLSKMIYLEPLAKLSFVVRQAHHERKKV